MKSRDVNLKTRTCHLVDLTVPADNIMKKEEDIHILGSC